LLVPLLAIALASCGKREAPSQNAVSVPIQIAADSSGMHPLRVVPPRAWIEKVSESQPPPGAQPSAGNVDPSQGAEEPEAEESEIPESAPRPLEIDDDLKPPIPKGVAVIALPAKFKARDVVVELDIRVDESGAVSDAMYAGGASDSTVVAAAVESALRMTFYPALKSGQPIAVWCRQRVDLGRP
jgi:hypothetical protein